MVAHVGSRVLFAGMVAVAACAPPDPDAATGSAITASTPLPGGMARQLEGPRNAPINSPMNAPMNAPLNSGAFDANGRPQANGLGESIRFALAANPNVTVMVGANARTAPAMIGDPGILLAEGVDQLGISASGDNLPPTVTGLAGDALAGASLGDLTLGQLDAVCPMTSFGGYRLPNANADAIDLYLPTMTVLAGQSTTDLTPAGVGALGGGIDTDGDGTPEPDWHVYAATMLVCDDLETNVILLGKPWTGTWHDAQAVRKLRPYEDDLAFLCVESSDPSSIADPAPGRTWWCFRGVVGEGVFGFAQHAAPVSPAQQSPGSRAFFLENLTWGTTTWDRNFMFAYGLAPIVERPPDLGSSSESTEASAAWWNLNPNDHAPTPDATRERHRQFLAAVAVKTATNRKGLAVSPYTVTDPPNPGELGACGEVAAAPESPAAVTPTPCELFAPCAASELGAARDCGWAADQVYACTPGASVVVGAGANVEDCTHPLGTGRSDTDTVLRVCDGTAGCTHTSTTNLGEGDDECGTLPSVAITCPASGVFGVMKATDDSAGMDDLAWDAPGGGVPGRVGVSATARAGVLAAPDVITVGTTCPMGAAGEARDCGWAVFGAYTCNPGTAVAFGVHDPATCTKLGAAHQDLMVRVCDGETACTWTSSRRLGHNDNACGTNDPTATFTCGLSGEFTAMYAPYLADLAVTRPRLVPVVTSENGVRAGSTYKLGRHVDVASSGDLLDGVLLHLAVPQSVEAVPGSPRACDWGSNWGVRAVQPTHVPATSCYVDDLDQFGFRVGASFDAASTWTRCPSFEPPLDQACTHGNPRKTFVKVKAGATTRAFVVPVGGARFRALTGMIDAPLPADLTSAATADCGGVPCCMAEAGGEARCVFQTACTEGLRFEVRTGTDFASAVVPASGAVGWSFQDRRFTSATIVTNHDWAFTADLRTNVAGNFKCEHANHETPAANPDDCAQVASCDGDGECDPGETGDTCPGDCANPNLGDLDALFADFTGVPLPPPLPPPTQPAASDVQPPCVTVLASEGCGNDASVTVTATSPAGAAVVFDAGAVDAADGPVQVQCAPRSGATFAPGISTVVCVAADAEGNVGRATLHVQVVDTIVGGHANLVRTARGPNGTKVSYALPQGKTTYPDPAAPGTHADACGAPLPPRDGTGTPAAVRCTPPPGSLFPIGVTTVECTAAQGAPDATRPTTFTITVLPP